jgi:hypothetical protein
VLAARFALGLSVATLWLPPLVEVGEMVLFTERAAPSQVVVPCFLILKVEEVMVEAFMSLLK